MRVRVDGELSRVTYHNSGHIYFSLKDKNSTIKAVMFRGNATKLRFRLEEGLSVSIDAALTLYTPRGEYQLNCFMVEPQGSGALALAYEQLKSKLFAMGYFDDKIKKPLPRYPKKIALITSATGAALQDMLKVASHRYPLVKIDVYDVLVQGEMAAPQIAHALHVSDKKGYCAIVVGRGGGSLEDLWAFNEEIVANAIFTCNTAVISAVGHEIDTLISDMVADVRAPTPSAAMQILLPDSSELLMSIDALKDRLSSTVAHKLATCNQTLNSYTQAYKQNSIEQKLSVQLRSIEQLKELMTQQINYVIQSKVSQLNPIYSYFEQTSSMRFSQFNQQVNTLLHSFSLNNPALKSKKGFAQIVKDRKIVNLDELKKDDVFNLEDDKVKIRAKVL